MSLRSVSTRTFLTTHKDYVETVITVKVDKSKLASVNIQTENCMRAACAKPATCGIFNTKRLSRLKKLRKQKSRSNEHSHQIKYLINLWKITKRFVRLTTWRAQEYVRWKKHNPLRALPISKDVFTSSTKAVLTTKTSFTLSFASQSEATTTFSTKF